MADIYISSTFEDLKKEREAVARAVRRLGHTAIAMEEYVASNKRPLEKCLEDVKKCHVYIGIFALRYGHIAHGHDKSITHLEYETARDAGIPCLVFLLDETANWPVPYVSTGEERQKIDKLRLELREEHIVKFFTDAGQLAGRVKAAVSAALKKEEKPMKKWVLAIASLIVLIAISLLFFKGPLTDLWEKARLGEVIGEEILENPFGWLYEYLQELKEKRFTELFSKAKDYYNKGDYAKALQNILEARKIKGTKKLEGLEIKTRAKLKEQKQQQDDDAFASAEKENTIVAYNNYLEKYSSGRHAAEARKLIKMPDDVRAVDKKAKDVYENKKGFWEADYGDGIKMVYIPAGEFTMGSNDYKDEKPPHKVYLNAYWMGKTEVTMKQYKAFISETGHRSLPDYVSQYSPGDEHPVIGVSWDDAVAYCKWLSKKPGLKFKLPTEAQWEKAARGTDGYKYPWENDKPDKSLANFDRNVDKTTPVDSYLKGASPYGLLNMAGNVWEWCNDWYASDYYKNSEKQNPKGPDSGPGRVIRGGGWSGYAAFLRCAFRSDYGPSVRYYDLGFRLSQDN